MIATAWNNGKHSPTGAGYGIKLTEADRDQFFNKDWQEVLLKLEGEEDYVNVNISKDSFWNHTCRELINKRIGIWLIKNKKAPWEKGQPPKIRLENIKENMFIKYPFGIYRELVIEGAV